MSANSDRIIELFNQARAKAAGEERDKFLAEACAHEPELRAQVESLLREHEKAGDFLQRPPVPPAASHQAGDRIGPYKLLQPIGEGGMGSVWMAEQTEPLRRMVALKIIKAGMDSKQVLARFEAERQALALMDHPNIAKVLDAGSTAEGRPYFVMELVKGAPLLKFCDEHRLSIRERLDLFLPVCHAIQHAHQKGIIHRDIKPSNVLVALYDGRPVPKVIDFGIAKAAGLRLTERTLFTEFGALIGTPEYMSPEQAELNQLDIDTRSDIYSLGVLLYELLTGTTPLKRETLRQAAFDEILRRIREEEPPRPSTRLGETGDRLPSISAQRQLDPPHLLKLLRGDLDWIVMKALEKERNRRYETANGLAMDLQRHLANEPVVARPPSNLYRLQKMVRRNKLAFGAAGAVAAVLVMGAFVSTWQAFRATRAEGVARAAERSATQSAATARSAETAAQAERRRAEQQTLATKGTLAAADLAQAVQILAYPGRNLPDGQISPHDARSDAVAYLVRSLRANSTNATTLLRLTSLLTYGSWALPVTSFRCPESVSAVSLSPDGKLLLIAAQNSARLWDASTGQPLSNTFAHAGSILSAQFSRDGTRVVTASEDQTAVVWDAAAAQGLSDAFKHTAPVRFAQFSPDGTRILTTSDDRKVRVWDVKSGAEVASLNLPGPPGGGLDARFSPDGSRVVTSSHDKVARVWEIETSRMLASTANEAPGSVYFNADGTQILTVPWDGDVCRWDARTGRKLTNSFTFPGSGPTHFSADARRMIHTVWDTARLRDAHTYQPLTHSFRHPTRVRLVDLSAHGARAVTLCDEREVHVWNVQTGSALPGVLRHARLLNYPSPEEPRLAHFTPDGRQVVSSDDNTVRFWDTETGREVARAFRHEAKVVSVEFSHDGNWVVTASEDRTVRLWNVRTREMRYAPLKHDGPLVSAQFSPDDKLILTASDDRTVRLWESQTGRLVASLPHNAPLVMAQFSPDGTKIVGISKTQTARLWELRNGQPSTNAVEITGINAAHPLRQPHISPDGKRIIGGGYWTVRQCDVATGKELLLLKHQEWTCSAQYSPDGKRILTGAWAMGACVWDAETGQPLTEPIGDGMASVVATFSADAKWIATASWDQPPRVWDSQTGQPVTDPLNGSGSGVPEFSADGKRLLTHNGRDVRLWDMPPSSGPCPEWLFALAEAVGGRALSTAGVLGPTSLNRADVIRHLREKLEQERGNDDWTVWGRWFLADRSTRTISPFSKLTIPEYVEERIQENTPDSLAEAERLAYGDPVLLERISKVRSTPKPAPPMQPGLPIPAPQNLPTPRLIPSRPARTGAGVPAVPLPGTAEEKRP